MLHYINCKVLIPVLILIALVTGVLIYTRPLSVSQICDDIDITKIESFHVTYERFPDDETVQYNINKDDPRFLLIADLIAAQRYRKTLWNVFPQAAKTHRLQNGDFKWELGCVVSEVPLKNGEIVSGSAIHISNFYGELEIWCAGKIWRCTAENQGQWISDIMDTIIVK